MKNYSLISKVTLLTLLAIGIIVSAMVFLGGNEAGGLVDDPSRFDHRYHPASILQLYPLSR